MNAVPAFAFLILLASFLADIYCGSFGLVLPFSFAALFYFSAVHGWRLFILVAFFMGALADVFYGRTIFMSPFFSMLAVAFSELWFAWGNTKSYSMHVFPGVALGLICALQIFLAPNSEHGMNFYLVGFSRGLLAMLAGGLILPMSIFFFDRLSKYFGFETYLRGKAGKDEKNKIEWT